MKRPFIFLTLSVFSLIVEAQTKTAQRPATEPFGKISMEDLEMKACDFEKDANAEVLFDKGYLPDGSNFTRHVRIKVFNDFGKSAGNVRLEYVSLEDRYPITNIQGETVNLIDGKPEVTPLDKKQVMLEKVDRFRSAIVFAMPNVKAGSVIDVQYSGEFSGAWFFQNNIPTRYSEIQTDFPAGARGTSFKFIPHVKQPYAINVGGGDDYKQDKALENVHSLADEAYMGSRINNLQRIEFVGIITLYNTWPKIGDILQRLYDRDQNIDAYISGEKEILARTKMLKSDNEKISFIYDQVKNTLKWNNQLNIFATETAQKVWDTKTGNSAEINWILYHLLKKAGIKSSPMIIDNKKYGKMNPAVPDIASMASMVVYIPVDSVTNYVLDATNKYNLYNVIPSDDLNTFGLLINKDDEFEEKRYQVIFLSDESPVMQSAFINGEISQKGKITGTADITSYSYNKIKALQKYKTDDEEKYKDSLRNNDNSIKITSLKLEDMEIDSLPLSQKIGFNADLTGSDENYIYFNPNLFNLPGNNPFIKEERFSDIDFGYRDNYAISGVYKLPAGYKTEALPKSITMVSPDESMSFKRIVAEEDGTVLIKFLIDHKKSLYFAKDYPDIRAFYKQMYELLNEQVVLKKM